MLQPYVKYTNYVTHPRGEEKEGFSLAGGERVEKLYLEHS